MNRKVLVVSFFVLTGDDVGNWGLQTVNAALRRVGYCMSFTATLPASPRPILLWDRERHHWLCLRDTGDALDTRWEIVDSQRGICVVDATTAAGSDDIFGIRLI